MRNVLGTLLVAGTTTLLGCASESANHNENDIDGVAGELDDVGTAASELAGPRPLFQLPFPCGEEWRLGTYAGHDDFEIDMFRRSGTTNGSPIVASFGGTVMASGFSGGAGNRVRIYHGDGWQTEYYHMIAAPVVSVGQVVQQGQLLGHVGSTGASGAPHLHFAQRTNGTSTAMGTVVQSYFNGVPSDITDDARANSYFEVSRNCGPGGIPYSEGQLIREPSGAIAVIVGGAVSGFASMAELSEAGYGSAPLTPVAAGVIAALPTVPRNGTLLRNNTSGAISVIAGGAALDFNTMAEISEQGYTNPTLVNLSNRQYQLQRAQSVPSTGTIIRDNTNGAMAVVAGGKGFGFANWGQVVEAGYEARPHVNMPGRHLSRLASARPSDGALLRDNVTGAMVVVAGNAGAGFATWQEVIDAGYLEEPITNVPGHYLPALRAAQPADRTLLRNNTTGAIVVVAGGARFGFATWQEVSDAGYSAFINVPPSYFTGSAAPRDGTLLRASKTTTVWLVTGGRRTVTVPPASAVIVDLPPAALATIPTA